MFEASTLQIKAFSDASNGIGIQSFNHVILFLIGILATIWVLMIFIGAMKNKERPVYESLNEFVWAVAIFTAVGAIIYYT